MLVLTFLFWTTPIFIAEAQYPKWSRFAIRLNPLAYVVRAYRDRLLSARPPAWEDVVIITLYSLAVFVAGGLLFRQFEARLLQTCCNLHLKLPDSALASRSSSLGRNRSLALRESWSRHNVTSRAR